jgi:hypothetical protein
VADTEFHGVESPLGSNLLLSKSSNYQYFMEPKDFSLYSREPITGTYPEPDVTSQ